MTAASAVAHRSRRYVGLLACLITALSLAVMAPTAGASFGGKLLAGQSTLGGPEGNESFIYGEEYKLGHNICLGPATWTGKINWPYGWKCSTNLDTYSFPLINAFIGVHNPNSFQIWFETEAT
jgi:hypothetical protein